MYKTILLTVDLGHSASWKRAIPEAVALARTSGGALHVMTVIPDFGTPLDAGFFPEGFQEKAQRKGAAELEALVAAEVPDDVEAHSHVGYGPVHDEVLAAVRRLDADLVVMASHAPDQVREFLVGSQADRVVRRSPVSVLIVRG